MNLSVSDHYCRIAVSEWALTIYLIRPFFLSLHGWHSRAGEQRASWEWNGRPVPGCPPWLMQRQCFVFGHHREPVRLHGSPSRVRALHCLAAFRTALSWLYFGMVRIVARLASSSLPILPREGQTKRYMTQNAGHDAVHDALNDDQGNNLVTALVGAYCLALDLIVQHEGTHSSGQFVSLNALV